MILADLKICKATVSDQERAVFGEKQTIHRTEWRLQEEIKHSQFIFDNQRMLLRKNNHTSETTELTYLIGTKAKWYRSFEKHTSSYLERLMQAHSMIQQSYS